MTKEDIDLLNAASSAANATKERIRKTFEILNFAYGHFQDGYDRELFSMPLHGIAGGSIRVSSDHARPGFIFNIEREGKFLFLVERRNGSYGTENIPLAYLEPINSTLPNILHGMLFLWGIPDKLRQLMYILGEDGHGWLVRAEGFCLSHSF